MPGVYDVQKAYFAVKGVYTNTTPVDAYEAYRAEVQRACQSVGIRKVHFIDEPVAAAPSESPEMR